MGTWNPLFVVFFLGILVFSNALLVECTTSQTENLESSLSGDILVGGNYASPYSALEIQLPFGWSGLRLLGVVTISPDGLEAWKHPIEMNASMIIVEYDRTELLEQAGAAVQESY
jgi:hypothetical protein